MALINFKTYILMNKNVFFEHHRQVETMNNFYIYIIFKCSVHLFKGALYNIIILLKDAQFYWEHTQSATAAAISVGTHNITDSLTV